MCGRFTLTTEDFDALLALTGVTAETDHDSLAALHLPRYNVAPMQEHWIVREAQEERSLERATWGLVNHWARSRREGARQINARSDSVARRPAFRDAFEQRRCAIPADGFFEWTGEGKSRRPWWFHRPEREGFLFAGLYEVTRLPGEEAATATFTILTTDANDLVTPVHDRMPVILPDDRAVDDWLYARQPAERVHALLHPVAPDYLVRTAVSTRVNSVQHDDPACLAEAESDTQGSLL